MNKTPLIAHTIRIPNRIDVRGQKCPFDLYCDWYDTPDKFEKHANECHGLDVIALDNENSKFRELQPYGNVAVFKFNDENHAIFLLIRLNRSAMSLIACVQFVGNSDLVRQHCYELILCDSKDKKRMSFVNACRRIEDEKEGYIIDRIDVASALIDAIDVSQWAVAVSKS